jgi:hypothetical protein
MIHVFAKKGLTSKTHVCLIALAISDCVAPVFPSVFWFYFFVVKKEFYYVHNMSALNGYAITMYL